MNTPNQKELSPIEKVLRDLKAVYIELEKEWERLDSVGTQVEKQGQISRRMVEVASQINWAQNYLKAKGNK